MSQLIGLNMESVAAPNYSLYLDANLPTRVRASFQVRKCCRIFSGNLAGDIAEWDVLLHQLQNKIVNLSVGI